MIDVKKLEGDITLYYQVSKEVKDLEELKNSIRDNIQNMMKESGITEYQVNNLAAKLGIRVDYTIVPELYAARVSKEELFASIKVNNTNAKKFMGEETIKQISEKKEIVVLIVKEVK